MTVLTCLVPRGALGPGVQPPGRHRCPGSALHPVGTAGRRTLPPSFLFCSSVRVLSPTRGYWVGLVGLDASPFWGRAKVHPRLRATESCKSPRGPSQGVRPAPRTPKVPQWKQTRTWCLGCDFVPTDLWCFTKLYALLCFLETKFISEDLVTLVSP